MFTRIWPALTAWGAGLIHLAVAAQSPLWLLVPLVVVGLGELVWGAWALRAGQMPRPAATLAGSAILALASLGLGVFGLMPFVPLAAASVFLIYIAGAAAALIRAAQPDRRGSFAEGDADRTERTHRSTSARTGAGRTLIGFAAGAALVAGLATPALALTDAGTQAVPHGEHGITSDTGHQH